jgi:hypothetical protein
MNNYQSNEENVWLEQVVVDDELEMIPVNQEKQDELIGLYNNVKPVLEDGSTYQLISMDVSENSGSYWGILNCRCNDQHLQIRF